jgi:hypothetical protein
MNREYCLVEDGGHGFVVTLNQTGAKTALSAGMLAGACRASPTPDCLPELRVGDLTGRGDVCCAHMTVPDLRRGGLS